MESDLGIDFSTKLEEENRALTTRVKQLQTQVNKIKLDSAVSFKSSKMTENFALNYSKIIYRMIPFFSGEGLPNDVYIFINNCLMAKNCAGTMTAPQEKEFTKIINQSM